MSPTATLFESALAATRSGYTLVEDRLGRQPAGTSFAEQQPDSDRAPGRGDLTLEQRISGVWEGLLRTGTADCPVCRGRMERAGARGHCGRCGSVLS